MKCKWPGISILLFISLSCCNISLFSQWQTDVEYGFKISIPDLWSSSSYTEGTDRIHNFISPDERIFIEIRAFRTGEGFTDELLARVFEESILQKGNRLNFYPELLNGLEGKMADYDVWLDGERFDLMAFFAVTPENGYILWALTETGQMLSFRWQIDQIMNSFTLIDNSLSAFEGTTTNVVLSNKIPSGEKASASVPNSSNLPENGNNLVYQGQTYRTVRIGSQTWMAENLNVGKMIVAERYSGYQSDNGIIEKYCFEDKVENCEKWGGLYLWSEMMQYQMSDNGKAGHVQGICPPGWHLPTDQEWTTLERYVDSDKELNETNWNKTGTRGTDAGKKLKAKSSWTANQYVPQPNGTDAVGFTVLAVGNKTKDGYFSNPGYDVYFWTATEHEGWKGTAYTRKLSNRFDNINRINEDKRVANPVRCVKD